LSRICLVYRPASYTLTPVRSSGVLNAASPESVGSKVVPCDHTDVPSFLPLPTPFCPKSLAYGRTVRVLTSPTPSGTLSALPLLSYPQCVPPPGTWCRLTGRHGSVDGNGLLSFLYVFFFLRAAVHDTRESEPFPPFMERKN